MGEIKRKGGDRGRREERGFLRSLGSQAFCGLGFSKTERRR